MAVLLERDGALSLRARRWSREGVYRHRGEDLSVYKGLC